MNIIEAIPAGKIAAIFIKKDIDQAEKAVACGDIVAMIRAYKDLQGTCL
jgi:hypothetical protein